MLVKHQVLFALVVSVLAGVCTDGFQNGTLKYVIPESWKAVTGSLPMRLAEFVLPRIDGDGEDGALVLYYFKGQGGSVQANLSRWMSQMVQPGDRPSRDASTTRTLIANGLNLTVLEIEGTYVAAVRPGATERYYKPDFKMVAAIVETPAGPYFMKLTGPRKTIERWSSEVQSFLRSVYFE